MPFKPAYIPTAFLFFLCMLVASALKGQDLLKTFTVVNKGGQNEISWVFDYNGVKLVGIQRSRDSANYYATIGHATHPAQKENHFVDKKPLAGNNYYRLFIMFTNGAYVFTHPTKIELQPATLSNSQGPVSFQPSIFVYTNPDGNVNISIADAKSNDYTIRFYSADNRFLFEVNKIEKPLLILDKSNFLHSGWFHYELYKNGKIYEKWKFFIPDSRHSGRP